MLPQCPFKKLLFFVQKRKQRSVKTLYINVCNMLVESMKVQNIKCIFIECNKLITTNEYNTSECTWNAF